MKRRKGQSLVETMIALGFFGIAIATVGVLIIEGSFSTRQAMEVSQATALISEAGEALRSIINRGWTRFARSGTFGLAATSTFWAYDGTSDTFGKYTRTVRVHAATSTFRDCLTGNITTATTTLPDVEAALATSTVTWMFSPERSNTIETVDYFTNWQSRSKVFTTAADWNSGTATTTVVVTNNDGEVQIGNAAKWNPAALLTSLNVPAGSVTDIDLEGNTLAIGTLSSSANDELFIYDVGDAATPVFEGSLNFSGDINGVAVDDDLHRVYIATSANSQEFAVVDITDPTAPSIAGSVDLAGNEDGFEVAFDGTEVYFASKSRGSDNEFFVINASATSTPSVAGGVELGADVGGMGKRGSGVVVSTSDNSAELRIIDVATPSSPSIAGTYNDPGNEDGLDVFVSGNTAYLVTQGGGNEFDIIDISTTSTPSLVGSFDPGTKDVNAVVVDDVEKFAYLATGVANSEFQVVNIATPSSPTLTTAVDLDGDAFGIAFRGFDVFLGTRNSSAELQVVRGSAVSNWRQAERTGTFDATGNIDGNAVWAACDLGFLGTLRNSGGAELYVVNVASSTAPTLAGSLELDASVNEMWLSEDRLYLATDSDTQELMIVSVATSTSPSLLATVDLPGNADAQAVVARGNSVYVSTSENASGAEFYALSTASSTPSIVGSYEVGSDANAIALATSTTFLATGSNTQEILALNVASSTPTFAGALDAAGTQDAADIALDSAGQSAFLMREGGNPKRTDFLIADVANPASMSTKAILSLKGKMTHVAAGDGPLVFVAGSGGGREIQVINASNQSAPVLLGQIDADGNVRDIFFGKTQLYAAGENNTQEFQIYRTNGVMGIAASASYESPNINLAATSTLNTISWTQHIRKPGQTVRLQIKTAPDVNGSPGTFSSQWSGPDGDEDGDDTDFFTVPTGELIHPSHAGDQWLKFRALLSGDGTDTPVLHDVTFTYTPQL